jgi:hypothetical protein
MSLINHRYIHGVTRALGDKGICKIANYDGVADSAYEYLQKIAMGEEMPAQPSPQELQQVQNSGLSEGDIQSAAKVVQVIAEMKQQADMAATAQAGQGAIPGQPSPAGPGGAVQGTPQPPMPPAPTGGGQPGGGQPGGGGQPPMG